MLRNDFPILETRVHGKPLVYLDNAATTQKPKVVIDAMNGYYITLNANIHRGVHELSQKATSAYENSRETVRKFLNAKSTREIIFTKGTTEAINLVAHSFSKLEIRSGDEIVISTMEHHSNIVPWQMVCEDRGAVLKIVPMTDAGELDFEGFRKLLSSRTKLVAMVHVSNALGTINPIEEVIRICRELKIATLIDGAQAVAHLPVDVQKLGCDFYAFSGHKIFGPTGVGVLYGREELLKRMPPYQGGGDMIASVTFQKTIYNDLPYKFEAGTPAIAEVIGLGVALDYVSKVGLSQIAATEDRLLAYATAEAQKIEGLRIIGTAKKKASVLSFVLTGIHPHDIGTILDQQGIAIRTGHHCAQPVMERLGIPATARASFAFYNTEAEIDVLMKGLKKVMEVFG